MEEKASYGRKAGVYPSSIVCHFMLQERHVRTEYLACMHRCWRGNVTRAACIPRIPYDDWDLVL